MLSEADMRRFMDGLESDVHEAVRHEGLTRDDVSDRLARLSAAKGRLGAIATSDDACLETVETGGYERSLELARAYDRLLDARLELALARNSPLEPAAAAACVAAACAAVRASGPLTALGALTFGALAVMTTVRAARWREAYARAYTPESPLSPRRRHESVWAPWRARQRWRERALDAMRVAAPRHDDGDGAGPGEGGGPAAPDRSAAFRGLAAFVRAHALHDGRGDTVTGTRRQLQARLMHAYDYVVCPSHAWVPVSEERARLDVSRALAELVRSYNQSCALARRPRALAPALAVALSVGTLAAATSLGLAPAAAALPALSAVAAIALTVAAVLALAWARVSMGLCGLDAVEFAEAALRPWSVRRRRTIACTRFAPVRLLPAPSGPGKE